MNQVSWVRTFVALLVALVLPVAVVLDVHLLKPRTVLVQARDVRVRTIGFGYRSSLQTVIHTDDGETMKLPRFRALRAGAFLFVTRTRLLALPLRVIDASQPDDAHAEKGPRVLAGVGLVLALLCLLLVLFGFALPAGLVAVIGNAVLAGLLWSML